MDKDFDFVEEGHIIVKNKVIDAVGDGFVSGGKDFKDYLVMPALINAHTHVGDSFAKEAAVGLSAWDACGPDGLKWKLYEGAERDELIFAMKESIRHMLNCGISCFADFREFGVSGIEMLKESLSGVKIKAVILGRELNAKELGECGGLGLNVYGIAYSGEKRNKIVAVHAGEEEGEIELALSMKPDIIVHATHATLDDIKKISKQKISVVICPRSNAQLGVGFPKVRSLLDAGINVALGTDNVMINSPDMFREMEFLSKISFLHEPVPAKEILKIATLNGAKALRINSGVIEKGRDANLIFIDKNAPNLKYNKNWVSAVVNRCSPENVRKVMVEGEFVVDKD